MKRDRAAIFILNLHTLKRLDIPNDLLLNFSVDIEHQAAISLLFAAIARCSILIGSGNEVRPARQITKHLLQEMHNGVRGHSFPLELPLRMANN